LYYANQQNINTYCGTQQHHTFLDTSYEQLPELPIPEVMQKIVIPTLTTELPHTAPPTLNPTADTLVYNFYNLDPLWHQHKSANRILLLEPSVFEQYPVSANSIQFCINLAVQNIPGIQVWVAEFSELKQRVQGTIYFKEHPLNKYEGTMDERSWLTGVKGNYHSFFAFWKQCQKELF
jgi:deoxyribodipyrimidine photo-lyase